MRRCLAAAVALGLMAGAARAEIQVRGGTTLSGNMVVPAALGQTSGGNLFHSFDVFNVRAGESVRFTGPDTIRNVVSRVLRGNPTLIDGPLSVGITGANFYFINPSGIVFGSGGSVQATGSVYFSTADVVRFPDGAFHANPGETSTLSSQPPSAFGFLTGDVGSIELRGSRLGVTPSPAPVPSGATFGLVANGIDIVDTPKLIVAPGANVTLASIGSGGDATLRADGTVDVSGFAAKGPITLPDSTSGPLVDVGQSADTRQGPGFLDVVQRAAPPPPPPPPSPPIPLPAADPPPASPSPAPPRVGTLQRPGAAPLPDSPATGSRAVMPTCEAGRSGLSSIVQISRGGLPADPDGYLPSRSVAPPAAESRPAVTPSTAGRQPYDSFVIAKLDCTG